MNTHFCPGGKICCNVFVFPPQVPLKGVFVPGPWVILRAPGEMHCTERTSSRLDESGKKYIKNMYKVYAVTQFNDLWISQTGLRGCVTDDGVTVWGQSNKILSLFKPCVCRFLISDQLSRNAKSGDSLWSNTEYICFMDIWSCHFMTLCSFECTIFNFSLL